DPRFTDEAKVSAQLFTSLQSSLNDLTPESLRTFFEDLCAKANEKLIGTFNGNLQEKHVTTNSVDIPINVYTPTNANKDKLVVYFHGGAWIYGSRRTHQTIVNLLADATKTVWISVEYRLGPEYKYPIWYNDACDVTRYIIENKESFGFFYLSTSLFEITILIIHLGVDRTAKVGVAGDSAGAMISTSVCQTVKNIDFQILVYGWYDFTCATPSFKEFANQQYFVTPELIDWCIKNAFSDGLDMNDPRISVFRNTSLEQLPPTLLIVAELDPTRDDSYTYKELLDKAGVKNKLVLIKGVLHRFFPLPGIHPKACAQAIDAGREFMVSIS
ncbi:unnamed protein product, partial [Rotaria sp. Silwood1]